MRAPNKDIYHDSAALHVTGKSVFVNDIDLGNSVLLGKVVYSKYSHANILSVDTSKALEINGVKAVLLAGDIPGVNQMGPVIHDEPCLAWQEVNCVGQAIALIAAENADALVRAEREITIEYAPLQACVDLKTAIEKNMLIAPARRISRGDVNSALKNSPHVLTGELFTNGQEHWYLETQSALAVPGEDGEMFVHASSQNPSETQAVVAEVLGLPKNNVEVEVKRMGGGFGGKETQGNHVAAWAALLANATQMPVKLHLFRDDDQVITGKRHPSQSKYEIGFDSHGKILAYRVEINLNAGCATDLSMAILERAMLHAENAYYIPHVEIIGKAYKTNLPSNTAFRGFGGPQGMAVIENAIDRIARYLEKDAAEIRLLNFYAGDNIQITPYGQAIENNKLHQLYDRLLQSSEYFERRKHIQDINSKNDFVKRGLALTPVKFGISFTTSFLNQAGALVNIYNDGTLLVNHGGTEMGQGLHTKIQQIAALEMGVAVNKVKVNATNTSKVPNTSPTAASSGSDINGMAVKNAIDILKARLADVALSEFATRYPGHQFSGEFVIFENDTVYYSQMPEAKISFQELVKSAYLRQISLSSTGFYRTPGIYFDRNKGEGKPFYYFSYGMAVSEVELDVLTGQYQLLRTDIINDSGSSINESIDIGQVRGAFIQGAGWVTTEELKWDGTGRLLTHSPDTYKIPAVGDIPCDFRVELLKDSPHEGTIRRSKAVGEPPFMLAFSVWLAIKDAVAACRHNHADPDIQIPATPEVVLKAIKEINIK